MKKDNVMKRGDINFQYDDNIVAVKWYDNRSVTLVGNCLECRKSKRQKCENTCALSFSCKEIQ